MIGRSRVQAGEKPMTRIALDAMGGDNAPGEIVVGAVESAAGIPDIKILRSRLHRVEKTMTLILETLMEVVIHP